MKNFFGSWITILLIIFLGSCEKATEEAVRDADGNAYTSVNIGTQTWLKENLKTSRYNDGLPIQLLTDINKWSDSSNIGYCWYNGDDNNGNPYGALYNWYAVKTGKLCPAGWHVPSDAEWTTLTEYLGGENVAGSKLKEAGPMHWSSLSARSNNESGFTALPGGYRNSIGSFDGIRNNGNWWTSTEDTPSGDENLVFMRWIYVAYANVYRDLSGKKNGYSVRCIKDN
ncbi:MAG: fibrobacter succinogenes major paralogous domain-containing protein [Bacteroidales bacterium]